MPKQLVVVEAWVPGPVGDAHPEHPIYIPILPPADSGLHPEHPIYFPVFPAHPIVLPPEGSGDPPHIWGGSNEPYPTPPIYLPVPKPPDGDPPTIWGGGNEPFPTPPIYLPVPLPPVIWGGANEPFPTPPIELVPPFTDLPPDAQQKLKDFLFGHLPPFDPPDYVAPV